MSLPVDLNVGNKVGELEEVEAAALQTAETEGPESCLDHSKDSNAHEVVTYRPSSLSETTEPISSGLQTLEELLGWQRGTANPLNVATVPLAVRDPLLVNCGHRTLVSHDMMGGYLDDRFIQGTDSEAPYAFYHWQYIDIFNYFGHNLVTIPPVVWSNAAHKHGVVVIGTFITEWSEGAKVCEEFLKDAESYRLVADRLVQISHYHGFDGWLINIENSLSAEAVGNTPLFLRYLSDQMHLRCAGSLVLWYDSVVDDGKLVWQNELNPRNRIFLDACDGFFTNYNWAETSLEAMGTLVAEDDALRDRQADIYVGVDVFARGEVVGGKWDTNKALKIIREHNFSAAIFAPGWVYETTADKNQFRRNQDKFWALLSDFLSTHRPLTPLPFTSSFCQGFGKALYRRGRLERQRDWFHLSSQELQPVYTQGPEPMRVYGCQEDAWNGGGSLLLEGLIPAARPDPLCVKVFSLHVPMATRCLMTLVLKSSAGVSVSLGLSWSKDTDAGTEFPVALDDGHLTARKLAGLSGDWSQSDWTVRVYPLELQGCDLREVLVLVQRERDQDTPFTCRLGEITVLDEKSLQIPTEEVQGVCIEDVVWLRGRDQSLDDPPAPDRPGPEAPCLNATLRWRYPSQRTLCFRLHWRRLRGPGPHVPPGPALPLGRAYSNLFRVTELEVPKPPALLELLVEPVLKEGFLVPESLWGRRSLSYTEGRVANQ